MKHILLACAAGASTSTLVSRMKEAAAEENYECEIEAMPAQNSKNKAGKIDVLLLGPQVKYLLKKVQKEFPDIPVDVIDMIAYGKIDGKKVLHDARKLMGDLDE